MLCVCVCVCVTSLPPTALVRITAEDTGGGMQLTVCNLGNDNKMKRKDDETGVTHFLPPPHGDAMKKMQGGEDLAWRYDMFE